MKKIFLQFGSGLGPMSRSLPIALALAKEGYEIKYLGYSSAKEYMEKAGIKELSSDFSISDIVKSNPSPFWNTAGQFWEMIGYGNMEWVENKVDCLIDLLKEFSPDYIVSDLGILGCLAARIMKIPLIAINQSCYHPNVPGGRLVWWEENVDTHEPILEKLNAYLLKKGAKTLECFTEIFTGDLTIIPSFPEFDPIDNLKQYNTHYIGPVLWRTKSDDDEMIKRYFEENKTNIFCYTARFRDNVGESGKKIFEAIYEGAKNINANIIISTGSQADYKEALELIGKNMLNNVKIVDYVPLDIAYGMSDLVIHHGGHGSCLGQFYYGVPSIVVPTHREREYNARICNKMGVSEFILRENLSASTISDVANKMLRDVRYKEAVNQWSNKYKSSFDDMGKVVNLVRNM